MSTGNKLQSLKSKMPKFKKLIVKLSLSIIALLILGGAYMFIRYNYIPNRRVDEIIQNFENGDENTKIEYAIQILSVKSDWYEQYYEQDYDTYCKIEELLEDKGYLNKSFEYIESMAFNGNAKCQYYLGKLYFNPHFNGVWQEMKRIVDYDWDIYYYWIIKAAEQGFVEAYYDAAEYYQNKRIGYDDRKDRPVYAYDEKGLEYIIKGALAGDDRCQLIYGDLILQNGQIPDGPKKRCTEEEFEEAKEWWRMSAKQGNKTAKKRLQTMFD